MASWVDTNLVYVALMQWETLTGDVNVLSNV